MIPWLIASALAAPAPVELPADYRGYLDQARFFLKKGWDADAEEQLNLAVNHPDGRIDPEAWFLLARVRYQLADLTGARAAAAQALTWSRDEDQAAATREWLEFLAQRFGTIELVAPKSGLQSRIELELQGTILDPELKQWLVRAEERLTGMVDLPIALGLPAGFTYTINGSEVTVEPGVNVRVPIEVRRVVAQSTEVQLSGGVGAWLGRDAANLFPAPLVELGVVVPVGRAILAGRAGLQIQPYEYGTLGTRTGAGGSLGIEAGIEDGREDALAIRGGVGFRYSGVPGLQVGCEGPCDLRGSAWLPGVWTSVLFQDRRRSSGLGIGMRATAEYALGQTDSGAAWAAPGIRALVDVSWAL